MVQKMKSFLICSNRPHYLLAGTILQPIFAMGKNRAMLKAKENFACEQAAYAYEKVVLNAFKDHYNAIAEYNKVKKSMKPACDWSSLRKLHLI